MLSQFKVAGIARVFHGGITIIFIFMDIVSNVYERWLSSGLKWCLIISHTKCQHHIYHGTMNGEIFNFAHLVMDIMIGYTWL